MTAPTLGASDTMESLVPCRRTPPGGRLFHLDFVGMSTLADVTAYAGESNLVGCALDSGVTVNGHQTLRYDPELANSGAQLGTFLTGGYSRLWSRVLFRLSSTLYDSGEPAAGAAAVPLALTAQGPTWQATAGLYRQVAAGDYRPGSRVVSAAETLEATGGLLADPSSSVGDLQGLDWSEWVTLTEKWYGGQRLRIRGWLNGVLVMDRIHRITTPMTDFWLTATVVLDPLLYAAENEIHLGEWTLWDAEHSPDPYGYLLFWVDSYDDFRTITFIGGDPKYNYGLFLGVAEIAQTRGGRGGPEGAFFDVDDNSAFLGRDLMNNGEEFEVTQQLWFNVAFGPPDADIKLCAWMSSHATAVADPDPFFPRHGNNGEHAALWWRHSDGKLEVRTAAGGTYTGATDVGAYIANYGEREARQKMVWVSATLFVHDSQGYIYVLVGSMEAGGVGVVTPYILAEDVDTAHTGAGVVSTVLGHNETLGPENNTTGLHFLAGYLLTRGGIFRLHECCWLEPNGDYEQDSEWSRYDGWDPDYILDPMPLGWLNLSLDWGDEPDDEGDGIELNTSLAAGAKYGFYLTKVPDPVCGGPIAALVPQLNVTQKRQDTFTGNATCKLYLKPGATRYFSATVGNSPDVIWKRSDATTGGNIQPPEDTGQPYMGVNGYQTFQPTIFPTNPDTGDAWDPLITDLVLGVEAGAGIIAVTHLGTHVVRVRPPIEEVQPGFEFPHSVGSWRPTQVRDPHSIGSYRAGTIEKYVHTLGAWRPLFVGAPPCPPYCPTGPEEYTTFFDGFDGPRVTRKPWGYAGDFVDGKTELTGGRIRFYPNSVPVFSGPASHGLLSQGLFDFRDGYVQVEITAFPKFHQAHLLDLYLSNIWIRYRRGLTEFGFGSGNAPGTIEAADSTGTSARFLRLRHSIADGKLYGEYSTVGFGGPWTILGSFDLDPDLLAFDSFGFFHSGWGNPTDPFSGAYDPTSYGEFDNFQARFYGHLR